MAMNNNIHDAIMAERERQGAKWNRPHEWGSGDCSGHGITDLCKLAVLAEEFGEVSRANLDRNRSALRTELVHVAAVAVAWLECLEAAR